MNRTEAAREFCNKGKSAYAFDEFVLGLMSDFASEQSALDVAKAVREKEQAIYNNLQWIVNCKYSPEETVERIVHYAKELNENAG